MTCHDCGRDGATNVYAHGSAGEDESKALCHVCSNGPLIQAVAMLDMSTMAAKMVLLESPEPLQRRLAWFAAELERLAGEAYRLADEAGDDPGANPKESDD